MFKESDIVLSAKHIVKQFPASHGRTLTACNDINLNVYKGKTFPPLPLTEASTWTWIGHPVSGLHSLTYRALNACFHFGSGP